MSKTEVIRYAFVSWLFWTLTGWAAGYFGLGMLLAMLPVCVLSWCGLYQAFLAFFRSQR